MAAGTIICAGKSNPNDLNKTSIDFYYSKDHAHIWHYLSMIAIGGHADVNTTSNGLVWKPLVTVIDHKMVCYFSDKCDKLPYIQKLTHRVSKDVVNWGN